MRAPGGQEGFPVGNGDVRRAADAGHQNSSRRRPPGRTTNLLPRAATRIRTTRRHHRQRVVGRGLWRVKGGKMKGRGATLTGLPYWHSLPATLSLLWDYIGLHRLLGLLAARFQLLVHLQVWNAVHDPVRRRRALQLIVEPLAHPDGVILLVHWPLEAMILADVL